MDMGQCNRIIINIVVIQSWFQILGGATERERERQRERQRQRETQRDTERQRQRQRESGVGLLVMSVPGSRCLCKTLNLNSANEITHQEGGRPPVMWWFRVSPATPCLCYRQCLGCGRKYPNIQHHSAARVIGWKGHCTGIPPPKLFIKFFYSSSNWGVYLQCSWG